MRKFIKKIYYKLRQCIEICLYGQICFVLPRSEWDRVIVSENNEPMVTLQNTERLICGIIDKNYDADYRVRKTIADKLLQVSQSLPGGYKLVLIEGYRSLQHQQYNWDQKRSQVKNEHPEYNDEQIESAVRQVVAKPSKNANHITGGAVDVTLCDSTLNLLDMGSPYPSTSSDMQYRDNFPMFAKGLTPEQEKNRKILRDTMTAVGFVYYPGEWWHYCYGDRMWAVYTGRSKCMYGVFE